MSELLNYINQNKQDAVAWQVERWLDGSGTDVHLMAKAVKLICDLLAGIKDPLVRNGYVNSYFKRLGLSKKNFADLVASTATHGKETLFTGEDGIEDPYANMPTWMDKKSVDEDGFCSVDKDGIVGYYAWGASGKTQVTNFIIHPIFFVKEMDDSTHIFEVQNHRERIVVEVPSKAMVSPELLQNALVCAGGNFIIFGSKPQMLRIATKILDVFDICFKIKKLGWHKAGFFAWVDRIYRPGAGFIELNRWGIAKIDDRNYLIPANSEVYKDLKEGDDDPFENERQLAYAGTTEVDIEKWAAQLYKVYGDTGLVIVAYFFITVFYDLVFEIDNNCPHIYFIGERGSGKSKAAKSLAVPFTHKRSPWQLNSGTDSAFFGYVSMFRNVPHVLNEFDDKVVRDEWFQSIKGFFDGEGRGKNAMDARNKDRQKMQKATGTINLVGQFLSTKDDNSIVTRSLVQKFHERAITAQAKTDFNLLQEWENEGLSFLLTQVLEHRKHIKENYYETFNAILGEWRAANNEVFNQRIMQNWCHTATMWKLLEGKFKLPVPYLIFKEQAYQEAVSWSKFVRSTDILSEFWNTVEYLLNINKIISGWDFKIEHADKIKLRNGDGKEVEKELGGMRKLLIIRLNTVHKEYQVSHKQRTGQEAMTLENLKHYFSNRNYYIGQIKQSEFKKYEYKIEEKEMAGPFGGEAPAVLQNKMTTSKTITSAYVFDYDLLGCELENSSPESEEAENKNKGGAEDL